MIGMTERRISETGLGMTNDPLGVHVDHDLLSTAGFNADRYSFSLLRDDKGGRYIVYVSDQILDWGETRPIIVIIESPQQRGAVRWREWYFGRIEGIPLGKIHGIEEKEEYYAKVRALVQPLNWDDGTGLQRKIEREIDRVLGGTE